MLIILLLPLALYGGDKRAPESPLDRYIEEASRRPSAAGYSPGSLYSSAAFYGDLARDVRASQVDDLITIVVQDRASALARGATSSDRSSSVDGSFTGLLGPVRAAGPLSNLIGVQGTRQLAGQGQTSRETSLATTLSARVTHVLPNGYLVVQGSKQIMINSERQTVTVRGIARWNDIAPGNQIGSDRLANLEVRIDGKGVVEDAIHRPHFLYRLLLGLLPF